MSNSANERARQYDENQCAGNSGSGADHLDEQVGLIIDLIRSGHTHKAIFELSQLRVALRVENSPAAD
ncbi:MAG TPA: hypothetical protein VFD58_08370 [Blastocatellia bacterium]|nr:hypothetical protein [Blastocatellia bacterium]